MTAAPMTLAGLVTRVRALAADGRVMIGIAGVPGVGKSTLAEQLVAALGPDAVQVPMDGFHLADIALAGLGLQDRKGAPETFDAEGYAALLGRIRSGEGVWAPGFDRDLEQPVAQNIRVPESATVVLSEGNYLLLPEPRWAQVRARFDEVWFLRPADDALRLQRLVERHVRFGKTPAQAREWVRRVDQPNARLVASSAGSADLIILS